MLDPVHSVNFYYIYISLSLEVGKLNKICDWLRTVIRCTCGSILTLVQILFPLFQTHYHQITITKTKEITFEPRIKLNHNIHTQD